MTQLPQDPNELVSAFAVSETRFPAYQALVSLGKSALPAIRDGLGHGNWQVRKWSAIVLDQVADSETLAARWCRSCEIRRLTYDSGPSTRSLAIIARRTFRAR